MKHNAEKIDWKPFTWSPLHIISPERVFMSTSCGKCNGAIASSQLLLVSDRCSKCSSRAMDTCNSGLSALHQALAAPAHYRKVHLSLTNTFSGRLTLFDSIEFILLTSKKGLLSIEKSHPTRNGDLSFVKRRFVLNSLKFQRNEIYIPSLGRNIAIVEYWLRYWEFTLYWQMQKRIRAFFWVTWCTLDTQTRSPNWVVSCLIGWEKIKDHCRRGEKRN